MDSKERLKRYFLEANRHIQKINGAKNVLDKYYPLDLKIYEKLDENIKDKIDVLIFRFSKLQDLLGEKIFRYYFEYSLRDSNIAFVKILAELEKEGILEIKKWRKLRDIRNSIAHEYPYEDEIMIENINNVIDNVRYLIKVKEKLEKIVNET